MNLPLARLSVVAIAMVAPNVTAQDPTLLVSGYTSSAVHAFAADGTPLGPLGAASGAQAMRYGPDGDLYVCAEEGDSVLRFDGSTGAPLGPFVFDDPATPQDETGGLRAPTAAVFGPDGQLYVASFQDDAVLRYDGATGAYVDDFIPAGTGAINGPDAGMDFGPDGHLYIPSFNNNRVLRYHGKTGAPLGAFVPVDLTTLSRPRCLRWRGDGLMYVTSWGNNRVLRYDLNGDLVDVFATLVRPTGLAFGPGGRLYVTSDQTNKVFVFDGATGAALGEFANAGQAGVSGATYLEWLPDPELHMRHPWPATAGVTNTFGFGNATPGGLVFVAAGVATTSIPLASPKAWFGVAAPLIAVVVADGDGEYSVTAAIAPSAAAGTLVLQAFDPAGACLSNLVVTTFD